MLEKEHYSHLEKPSLDISQNIYKKETNTNKWKRKIHKHQQFLLGVAVAWGSIFLFQATQALKSGIRVETKAPKISEQFVKQQFNDLLNISNNYKEELQSHKSIFFKDAFKNFLTSIDNSLINYHFQEFGDKASFTNIPGNPKLVNTFVQNGIVNYQYAIPFTLSWTIDGKNNSLVENGNALINVVQDPMKEDAWLISRFLLITDTFRQPRDYIRKNTSPSNQSNLNLENHSFKTNNMR